MEKGKMYSFNLLFSPFSFLLDFNHFVTLLFVIIAETWSVLVTRHVISNKAIALKFVAELWNDTFVNADKIWFVLNECEVKYLHPNLSLMVMSEKADSAKWSVILTSALCFAWKHLVGYVFVALALWGCWEQLLSVVFTKLLSAFP